MNGFRKLFNVVFYRTAITNMDSKRSLRCRKSSLCPNFLPCCRLNANCIVLFLAISISSAAEYSVLFLHRHNFNEQYTYCRLHAKALKVQTQMQQKNINAVGFRYVNYSKAQVKNLITPGMCSLSGRVCRMYDRSVLSAAL
jgi:hypothetical protein